MLGLYPITPIKGPMSIVDSGLYKIVSASPNSVQLKTYVISCERLAHEGHTRVSERITERQLLREGVVLGAHTPHIRVHASEHALLFTTFNSATHLILICSNLEPYLSSLVL